MSYTDDDETLGGESLEEYVDETYEEGYEPMEGDVEESARTMGNGYHGGIKSKKKFYAGNKREALWITMAKRCMMDWFISSLMTNGFTKQYIAFHCW